MNRRRIVLAGGLVALVVVLYAGFRFLENSSFFQIRRIELVGGTYLTPADIARAIAVPARASIFDDTAPLVARVRRAHRGHEG